MSLRGAMEDETDNICFLNPARGLSRVRKVEIQNTSRGWVETSRSLDELVHVSGSIRAQIDPGLRVTIEDWSVSSDSLYGEIASIDEGEWVTIPAAAGVVCAVTGGCEFGVVQ